jgi:UDP-2,3-diacylglucosamine hydrolase
VRPTYFLSDLHLRSPDDARTQRALSFLRARAGEAETVYLVGDVFDLWLGYRSAIFSAYFPVLRALADLVDAGTEVVLFPGNHDPDSGSFLREHLGVTVAEEPHRTTLGGRRIWLEHGDVHDPRAPWRRVLNRVARHPGVHRLARGVHPDLLWAAARVYGDALRGAKGYHGLPVGLVGPFLEERASAGADVVIIGHYHRALSHEAELGGRRIEFFVLGDWVAHHTYLRFDGAGFQLFRDRAGTAPEPLPRGDHPPPPDAG